MDGKCHRISQSFCNGMQKIIRLEQIVGFLYAGERRENTHIFQQLPYNGYVHAVVELQSCQSNTANQ